MPVPWTAAARRIPQVEHRAITIQQLRDLHVFVERLCKTRLLRDANDKPISIFDVNMYHIAQHIIKPAIAFHEEQRGTRRRYSWVEFITEEEQQVPAIMFSHSWAGRFQDFMAVVNRLKRSRGFSGSVAIWICTFANSQFGEDFGTGLRDSPFFKAIGVAKEAMLVVDRDASSLQRIWCGFELHVTMRMEKRLSIFTSMGQVGVSVTTGPLIEAIEAWDVRRMEATQASDRRQILNYLSGGERCERQGLKTDKDGNLLLLDGWRKQLDGEDLAKGSVQRCSGVQEYAHEARLFQEHADTFHRLNVAVRAKVKQAAKSDSDQGGQIRAVKVPSLTERGLTLGELRTCVKRLKAMVAERGGKRWEDWSLADVISTVLVELIPEGYSYAEVVSEGPRTPQFIIDEVWYNGIHNTMSAIEWAAEALQMPDAAVLYFGSFCVDVRRHREEWQTWDADARTLIRNSYGWITILPTSREGIIRGNRMHQMSHCFMSGRPVYFACTDGVLAGLKPFKASCWEFGNFSPSIAKVLLEADWEDAKCHNKEREAKVREQVRALPGGFSGFRARLANPASGPVLRDAVTVPGPEGIDQVEAVCRRKGLKINSGLLSGSLGETPLHIAAAVGNIRAMEVLLAYKADPNAEDHILETPLHYAATSGMATSVKVLLTHGAIAQVESAFAESPLLLARQNPASFLGKDTSKVVALLEAWEAACEEEQFLQMSSEELT